MTTHLEISTHFNALFMIIVGALKALGFLRHYLSPLAGSLEFIGGIMLLIHIISPNPSLPKQRYVTVNNLKNNLDVQGCICNLLALGIILSTGKRRSPVCWIMTILNLGIVSNRSGGSRGVMGFAVAGLIGGFTSGVIARVAGVDIEVS
ncbi:hypothetical protein TrCOL_g12732 [Triparma columacea]|uniref:Uncharacterized protein n=1 Tax=Triparma columacea TaxID=722753 RepID=A0A9W7LCE5_9STRA|nr:hypothetical protein TrCOL_g12732 [Triparma columacea]